MDQKAVTKAQSRLRVATKAAGELEGCETFDDFCDTWYTFLVAAKNIYTVLEQGAKVSAQSRQWYGGVKDFRRNDELLTYIFEARNDDEHGLENSAELAPGHLIIGKSIPGTSQSVRIDGMIGPGGTLRVTSLDGKPVAIEAKGPHARLVSVTARGDRTIFPPTRHLGDAIGDASPLNVARLGLIYLEKLIEEASNHVQS